MEVLFLLTSILLWVCENVILFGSAQELGIPHPIRLVGPTAFIGQVQIRDSRGRWSSICHTAEWTLKEATVVCRELGYTRATSRQSLNYAAAESESSAGRNAGEPIRGFKCGGDETNLDLCRRLEDAAVAGMVVTCSEGYGGVVCQTPTETLEHPVRLANGKTVHEGRVEIKHSGVWTTVCDYGWDKTEADVVCRQLGYLRAIGTRNAAYYGEGTGTILLSNVSCRADDLSLRHDVRFCDNTDWYPSLQECTHLNDAGVECDIRDSAREIRLAGPQNDGVQVRFNDEWTSICDENWNMRDAHVVCRQLGYRFALEAPPIGYHGSSYGGYYLRNFLCAGDESRLDMCKPRGAWNLQRCSSRQYAGVKCLPNNSHGGADDEASADFSLTSLIIALSVLGVAAIVIPLTVYLVRRRLLQNRTIMVTHTVDENGISRPVAPSHDGDETSMTPIPSIGGGGDRYVTTKDDVTLVDDMDD